MIERQLIRYVDRVAGRIYWNRLLGRLATVWIVIAVSFIGVIGAARGATFAEMLRPAAGIAGSLHGNWLPLSLFAVCLVLSAGMVFHWTRKDRRDAARRIESAFPDLKQRLLAALEQQPHLQSGRFGYLQAAVIHESLGHARRHDWRRIVPAWQGWLAGAAQLMAYACVALAIGGMSRTVQLRGDSLAAHGSSGVTPLVPQYELEVEPGDTAVERGTPLLVLARFAGALPADVELVWTPPEGTSERIGMTKSLDDPLFGGRIADVEGPIRYHIAYADRHSEEFQVEVFDYPQLERADALVQFPEYTHLPDTVLEDARHISIVEGSTVTLTCRLNKPVPTARLLSEADHVQTLEPVDGDRHAMRTVLRPEHKTRYRLELIDEDGRRNKFPPEFVVEVTPNLRPELKLAFPARDLRVSPLEEVTLEASVIDDFGLDRYGVIFAAADSEPRTVVLGERGRAKEPQRMIHLMSLEELEVAPDDLVSYYFYADDIGPDGAPRRTFSDMFFAEVRHFEEIFREGQSPSGGGPQTGGGQQSQDIEKLLTLQKQIVSATWALIRRETSSQPSDAFAVDVSTVRESQHSVREHALELGAKLNDAHSKIHLDQAVGEMARAVEHLTALEAERRPAALPEVMKIEQAAYQSLLKLRAREHQVAQSQSSGGGQGGGSSRSGQQLQQLELSNEQNRYESERRTGEKPADAVNREQLQVLNRLRELARRQAGVNEKLKELENQLRLAQTEAEREDIRRRLKRLRDEQQQMLRDVDELRNRMDRPENQNRMADSRQQLEETRSRVLEASEALKRGQVSQALNSGTRAERDLNQLRDAFRDRTAGQFADAVRQLRHEARELDRREQQLGEELQQAADTARSSLRYAKIRQQLARGFGEQQEKLEALFEQMRHVIEKSEASEPLLSKQLYETVRNSRTVQPSENLKTAQRLMDRGLVSEAGEAEQQARRGIDIVRRGIEQAADAVLGSDLDAMRRARDDLRELADSLEKELAQAEPGSEAESSAAAGSLVQTAERDSRNSARQNGEQGEGPAPERPPSSPDSQAGPAAKSGRENQPSGGSPSNSASTGSEPDSPGSKGSSGETPGGNSGASPSAQPAESTSQKPGLRGSGPQSGQSPSQSSSPTEGGNSGGPGGPLTGNSFQEWSDQMRNIEEMLDDPQLRHDVAQIRDRARSMRAEFKRHSRVPEWELVRESILQPMAELQLRLAEEVARRESPDALVPIDRDPIPDRFAEMVRRYYERLGRGK